MSVNTKMTAIADKIRTLSGTTAAMGLDAMASNIENANTTIETQTDLMTQIKTALQGKGVSGGGSSTLETCTVTINYEDASDKEICFYYFSPDENGNIVNHNAYCKVNNSVTLSVIKDYPIISNQYITVPYFNATGDIERMILGSTIQIVLARGDGTYTLADRD